MYPQAFTNRREGNKNQPVVKGSGNKKSRLGLNRSASGLVGGSYRLDAVVRVGDQQWLRRRWASGGVAEGSQLPWRFTRTEPARVYHGS